MEGKEALRKTYFAELDPDLRGKLLEQYSEANPQEDDIGLLRTLWTLRYTDPKNAGQQVDTFLWQMINLICLYRVSGFFSRGTEKEISDILKTLGFSDAAAYGDAGREILYLEFRNTARRYFGTCEDKFYGKKLMGIVTMNENERMDKMAREVWQVTQGLPQRFKTDDDMALFCRAVHDEFIDRCPDGEKRLASQEKRHKKKRIA